MSEFDPFDFVLEPLYMPSDQGYTDALFSKELSAYDPNLETGDEGNHRTWIARETKSIVAAFKPPSRPVQQNRVRKFGDKRSVNERYRSQNAKMGAEVVTLDVPHSKNAVWEPTAFVGPNDEKSTVGFPQASYQSQMTTVATIAYGNEGIEHNGIGNGNCSERDHVVAPRTEVEPIAPLTEVAHPTTVTGKEEPASEQTWRIDGQGHLILSEPLFTELMILGTRSLNPITNESQLPDQRATVARLAAEDKQLDAFHQALKYTCQDLSSEAGELEFKIKTGRYTYAPGITYPVIAILMPDWRQDTDLQCYLAYYLLRGMLRRYGGMAFPDRVDVRESGFGGGRLLVAYGADQDGADGYGGEAVRVRRRIMEEMLLREMPMTGP
ncbi:hypothetical protein F5B17DRAFT_374445 [Nemania serpens]|nr:hypothetical protein F5B17DRAFT_374445 [Nemania serpens]